jgi:hypothetical protein
VQSTNCTTGKIKIDGKRGRERVREKERERKRERERYERAIFKYFIYTPIFK